MASEDGACTCGWLERSADEPDVPIEFDARMNEYSITYRRSGGGSGSLVVRYCPWCGSPAPASRRGSFFARITSAEHHRLEMLTVDVKTVEDAFRVLGPPDDDRPLGYGKGSAWREDAPQVFESFRVLVYRNLSETAEVHAIVESENRLRFMFIGKYIGGAAASGGPTGR